MVVWPFKYRLGLANADPYTPCIKTVRFQPPKTAHNTLIPNIPQFRHCIRNETANQSYRHVP